jgi:hypothetical protein
MDPHRSEGVLYLVCHSGGHCSKGCQLVGLRICRDYLEGESDVEPSEGDTAPFGNWESGTGDGCPFNIGGYFDESGWVLSQDIQQRDPPVLFYNLFACGPGRFTDENYLAGAYIFHTTYGLITMASSKSGSMLNFNDFTISGGKNVTITGSGPVKLYIEGKFTLSGGSRLVVSAGINLTIYVKGGDFDASGNSVVNLNGDPTMLTVYSSANGKKVDISGDSAFYGLIYAPLSNVTITGGSDFLVV